MEKKNVERDEKNITKIVQKKKNKKKCLYKDITMRNHLMVLVGSLGRDEERGEDGGWEDGEETEMEIDTEIEMDGVRERQRGGGWGVGEENNDANMLIAGLRIGVV